MASNRRVHSWLVSTRHARLALLVVLAAAGCGGAYAVDGIASVDNATAAPKPDPPPTTTYRAPPPPPPAVPPPPPVAPPPPPPPVETYAPPPPPPPPSVAQTRVAPVTQKLVKRHKAPRPASAQPVATWVPRPPDALRPKMLTTVQAAATTGAPESWSSGLALLLWPAFGLALIGVLIAALPPWVLPAPVAVRVYERREALLIGGLAAAVSISVGVVVALLAA
jgi:hypothetical protein